MSSLVTETTTSKSLNQLQAIVVQNGNFAFIKRRSFPFVIHHDNTMLKLSSKFEKYISFTLLGFAMIIVSYQVIQLIWNSIESFVSRFQHTGLEYAPEYGRTIAILFFNILLMLEIMQTIKVFSSNHIIKVRIILIVCLIAVSRKILALGEETIDPKAEFALAALILSLSTGYFLVSRYANTPINKEPEDEVENHKL